MPTKPNNPAPAPKGDRVQFNARIAKDLKQAVKMDCVITGATIDEVAAAILRKFYRDHPQPDGRKEIYRAAGVAMTA